MTVYVYTCAPMDCHWGQMIDLYDFLKSLEDHYGENWHNEAYEYLRIFKLGRDNAKWFEGDFAQGPKIMFVPTGESWPQTVITWKQSNNGTTFYASDRTVLSLEDSFAERVFVK